MMNGRNGRNRENASSLLSNYFLMTAAVTLFQQTTSPKWEIELFDVQRRHLLPIQLYIFIYVYIYALIPALFESGKTKCILRCVVCVYFVQHKLRRWDAHWTKVLRRFSWRRPLGQRNSFDSTSLEPSLPLLSDPSNEFLWWENECYLIYVDAICKHNPSWSRAASSRSSPVLGAPRQSLVREWPMKLSTLQASSRDLDADFVSSL